MTLVIDPKAALLKGVDPVQFCVFKTDLFFMFSHDPVRSETVLPIPYWKRIR